MEALLALAREPLSANASRVAELRINECLRILSGSEKENAIKQLRERAEAAAAERPTEASFWDGVIDYLKSY